MKVLLLLLLLYRMIMTMSLCSSTFDASGNSVMTISLCPLDTIVTWCVHRPHTGPNLHLLSRVGGRICAEAPANNVDVGSGLQVIINNVIV